MPSRILERETMFHVLVIAGLTAAVSAAAVALGLLGAAWYLALMVAFAALVLWHPLNAFVIFILLTPVHTLSAILVYSAIGEPGIVMMLFQAWKEMVLLVTIAAVVVVLVRGHWLTRLTWVDGLALAYMGLAIAYVLFPGIASDGGSLSARIYGFRESVLPPVVYLVGRAVPATWSRLQRAVRWLVLAAVVWSVLALLEVVIDPGDLLRTIRYTQFQIEVMGASGELNAEGLAHTYTTSAGIRRVGSVFLHPLGFAIALLFVLPLLLGRAMDGKSGYLAASILAVGALFATLSRGPLAMLLFSVFVIFAWRGQMSMRTAGYGALVVLAVVIPFGTVDVLKQYVADTLAARDFSTIARLANLALRLTTFRENLWLGTGISSATREGVIGGAESELLQIGLRFGLLGLLAYLSFVAGAVKTMWRCRTGPHRTEFMWAGVSMLVLNVYGLVNPLWRVGFHVLVIWFAWGLMATQAMIDEPVGQRVDGRESG